MFFFHQPPLSFSTLFRVLLVPKTPTRPLSLCFPACFGKAVGYPEFVTSRRKIIISHCSISMTNIFIYSQQLTSIFISTKKKFSCYAWKVVAQCDKDLAPQCFRQFPLCHSFIVLVFFCFLQHADVLGVFFRFFSTKNILKKSVLHPYLLLYG